MLQLTVTGNLGQDAEIKEARGKEFVTFSIASTEKYTNKDGDKIERTTWVSCITNQTVLAPYLVKGKKVLCQGTPKVEVYQAKDGDWKVDLKLNCRMIELLSPAPSKDETKTQAQNAQPATTSTTQDSAADDLPF